MEDAKERQIEKTVKKQDKDRGRGGIQRMSAERMLGFVWTLLRSLNCLYKNYSSVAPWWQGL